jgi:hypothetical protein
MIVASKKYRKPREILLHSCSTENMYMHLRFVVEESVRHLYTSSGVRENGLPPKSCHTNSGNSSRGAGMTEALALFLLESLMSCVGVCAWTHRMDAE